MHLCSQILLMCLYSLFHVCNLHICLFVSVYVVVCDHRRASFSMFASKCQACVCVKSHLAQSLQQDGDARQSLGSPLVVTVTKHETHQLRISGTHRLLKNWRREGEGETESKTEPITQASSKIYVLEQFKGAVRIEEKLK